MKGITIRSALPEELETVARATVQGFTARADISVADILPADMLAAYEDTSGREEDGDLLVAVDDITGQIVGTASLLWDGTKYARFAFSGEAELRFVAVLPAYRGWGIAQALTSEAIRRALGWGVSAVVLSARPSSSSYRVYQRIGFTRSLARENRQPHGRVHYHVYERHLVAVNERDISIRMIRPDEIDDVARLLLDSYSTEYELNEGYRADLAAVERRAQEHEVWVAVDHTQRRIVGTVATPRPGRVISTIGEEGEMDLRVLAVAPDARGLGIASRLVNHVVTHARTRGAARVILATGPEMARAQRLYERLGFVRRPERETHVIAGTRLLIYTFELLGSDTESDSSE